VEPLELPESVGIESGALADVTLTGEGGPMRRTMLLTPGPNPRVVFYSFRGYRRGEAELGGRQRIVALVDSNGDLSFNNKDGDLLVVDLNADGALDVDEARAPAEAIRIGSGRYLVGGIAGSGATLALEPREVGEGRLVLAAPETVTLEQMALSLRHETREARLVRKLGEPITLPAGYHVVTGGSITVDSEDDGRWFYPLQFGGDKLIVAAGETTTVDLFSDCGVDLSLSAETVAPGDTVRIDLVPTLGNGVRLGECKPLSDDGRYPRSPRATVVTRTPDGEEIDRGDTGFG
jgi:hypothetical protein